MTTASFPLARGYYVVVAHHRGCGAGSSNGQVRKNLWCIGIGAADGGIHQRLQGIHLILRRLHRQGVADAVLRIHPKGGRGLKAGTQ